MLDLRTIARALGGEVTGGQVLAPGPGHSPRNRSMSVRLSPYAPDGFIAHSFAGDDWRTCRDHVRDRLGIDRETAPRRAQEPRQQARAPEPAEHATGPEKIAHALVLWREGVDPRGTIAEAYLNGRKLTLGADIAGSVLRWHPDARALLALFRNVLTGKPQAVSRTYLTPTGEKLTRKFLGPTKNAAVMLDAFDAVTAGLHIGEGVETCMSARQLDLRPAWALGSKGAIGAFPVLGGIEALTILEEPDAAAEAQACAARWHAAGREIYLNRAVDAKDLNDVLKGAL